MLSARDRAAKRRDHETYKSLIVASYAKALALGGGKPAGRWRSAIGELAQLATIGRLPSGDPATSTRIVEHAELGRQRFVGTGWIASSSVPVPRA